MAVARSHGVGQQVERRFSEWWRLGTELTELLHHCTESSRMKCSPSAPPSKPIRPQAIPQQAIPRLPSRFTLFGGERLNEYRKVWDEPMAANGGIGDGGMSQLRDEPIAGWAMAGWAMAGWAAWDGEGGMGDGGMGSLGRQRWDGRWRDGQWRDGQLLSGQMVGLLFDYASHL